MARDALAIDLSTLDTRGMPLLDGLDRVPWDQLSHAYGPATDVPGLLRALVDDTAATPRLRDGAARQKRSIRSEVIWQLWGNVFHQGTRWQVTSHVVPFLAELLRDGPTDADLREFLVSYLHHIAYGYPADIFPQLIVPARDFPADVDEMTRYAVDCYRAVEQTLPLVAPLARDANDAVAFAAIALLGGFYSDISRAGLRAVVDDAAPQRRALALVALAQLDPATTRTRAMPLIADADAFVAVHAAVAAHLADLEDVPAGVVDVLVRPLGELTEAPSPLANTVGGLVARSLELLPAAHRGTAIRAMAASLATAEVMTNLSITASLLGLALQGRAPAAAAELSAEQRVAVEAIVAHGAFLWHGNTFGNYSSLLRNYGLPTTADALRAWLAR